MRVLFMHAAPEWDGRARVFAIVARALADRGYDTWVAAPAGSEVSTQVVAAGINLLALPHRRGTVADTRQLRALLPRDFVDVAFVHSEHEHLVAALAARWAGHGMVVRRVAAGERLTIGWRSRRADSLTPTRLLYTSESPPSGTATASGSLPALRAELGAAVVPKQPSDNGSGAPVLVCVATRHSLRRATNVVRATALLAQRHTTLRLRVLGSAAHDEDLKLLASALGIGRRVDWLGHPRDAGAAVRGAAAGWVVADGDDAGLGVLDLMANSVAVLAERTTVAARYVSDGIHGELMAHLDPALMAAETAVLLADPERREAIGAAARARVEREFPLREMLAGFEQAVRAAKERRS